MMLTYIFFAVVAFTLSILRYRVTCSWNRDPDELFARLVFSFAPFINIVATYDSITYFIFYFLDNEDYNSHLSALDEDSIRITYKDFKSYYAINPYKWHYSSYLTFRYNNNTVGFKTCYDFCRARWFYEGLKKNKSVKKNNSANEIAFLNSIQKDIDELKAKSEREIQEAIDKLKENYNG